MPKSKKRKKKAVGARRASSRTTNRPARRLELPPLDSLVRPVIRGGSELLEIDDPMDVERWASQVLGVWFKLPLPPFERIEFEKQIRPAIVDAAEAEATPDALAVLRAFAAMEPDPIARPASEAAGRLAAAGVVEPRWADELARGPELIDVWSLTDPYGDQDGYYFSYRYPDRPIHMVMAMIDRNIGGVVKDAFCRVPTADVRAKAEQAADVTVADADPAIAAAEILHAIETGDMYIDNHWTDEFKDTRALLRARMSRLPQAALADPGEPLDNPSRDAIVRDFLDSADLSDPDAGERIVELAVDYACDYTPDGDPYRWSPIAVELFLVDWLPRKALLDAGEIRAVPEVMKAWVGFALAHRGLPAHLIEETKEAVDEYAAAFRSAATDQTSFGPAKAIANAMMASGVDLSDQAAVGAWIEEFNQRPFHERDQLLGPSPFDPE